MALRAPHQSSVPIQTGNNPGPAASLRSPDAFSSTADKMLAPALRDLSQGLGVVGDALQEEKVKVFQNDLENYMLGYKSRAQNFIEDFKANNVGRNAVGAEDAFLAFNQKEADDAKKIYGNNNGAMLQLTRSLGPVALSGAASMRDYGREQAKVYDQQTFDGKQAQYSAQIEADPANAQQYIDAQVYNFRQKYPGAAPEWVAANTDKIKTEGTKQAFASALKRGDLDTARRIRDVAYQSGTGGDRSGFVNPLPGQMMVTSEPGYRNVEGGSKDHGGYDFRATEGTELRSSTSGTVIAVKSYTDGNGGGNRIYIKTDDGQELRYMHLGSMGVTVGQRVAAGDIIGATGSSGRGKASGGYAPHLHMELLVNGKNADFGEYLTDQKYKHTKKTSTESARVSMAPKGLFGGESISSDSQSDDKPVQLVSLDGVQPGMGAPQSGADDGDDAPVAMKRGNLVAEADIAWMDAELGKAQDDHFVKNMTGSIANAFQNGTEVEIASSISHAFGEIKKVGDPDRQNSMMQSLQQNIDFYKKDRDAADMEGAEKFLAETEGLSPLDRKNKLREWDGLSRKARGDLAKKIDEGTVNKVTPENQEAYDRLRVEIDNRRNAGEPMSDTEIKALAQQNGLTVTQAKGLEDYRAKGGMAGVEGFAGKVSAIYKELGRGKGDAPSGFVDLVARNLPSGKTPTPEELRGVVVKLMYSEIKGESVGRIWDTSETYPEAAKSGRAAKWLPNIIDDEERAELTLEIKARIEAGEFPDNPITEEDLRDYKRVYKMGLPPRPPQPRTNAALPTLSSLQTTLGR